MAAMTWLNGEQEERLPLCDRGLQYGDGFFTTSLIIQGQLLNAPAHWQRLQASAHRLYFSQFDLQSLQQQVLHVLADTLPDLAVLKILVTRGCGGKGYALPTKEHSNTVIQLLPYPVKIVLDQTQSFFEWISRTPAIAASVLQSRWGIHSQLAGLKHINRLENVLARQELHELGVVQGNLEFSIGFAEGVMLNENREVISGTQSNLVARIKGQWVTPKLHHSGVMGTTLRRLAEEMSIEATTLSLQDLARAEALFFCNAVRGVMPVACLAFGRFAQQNLPEKVDYAVDWVAPVQQLWAACLQQDFRGERL